MAQRGQALGVDFGTSNSAAGYLCDGKPRRIEIAPGQTNLPTTFFFDFDTKQTLIGEPANQALLDGAHGRFMRALKRVLGTTLMYEKRQILNERVTFVEIIGRFLHEIKMRAEIQTGLVFDRALSGRPVVFHGLGDKREDQAEADLRACYLAAGFREVDFMPEPEAAAIASDATGQSRAIGLIVDVGGGTSDFSLFRSGDGDVEILANHGIRIGGTDFDRSVSIDRVMPLLGRGSQLRKLIGPDLVAAPNAIFYDLATWEKIPFLYSADKLRMVEDMKRVAQEPDKIDRLVTVLQDRLGHDLAFAVERGKIKVNSGEQQVEIALEKIEPGLTALLQKAALQEILRPYSSDLRTGALETVRMAGLDPSQVERVIYVGGSSLMTMVSETMTALFPNAEHSFSEVFTAVTDGLALAAGRT
ncbi:MAG: Hsp70 family protein [Rhizobiaceae bacterium]|nr:Hsp70 family protein [Rhizobiaceae bacterium]